MDLLIFIVALSILVLVHEWGHFIAARKTGVRVEEFGLGLPPRIIGKKIKDTIYSINWLPVGGFCKLYGEDGDGKGGKAFNHKKPWQKLIIVLGGVVMNMVLAIVLFTFVYSILGVPKRVDKVKIVGVAENSPAEMVGLKEGDWISKIGDIEVKNQEILLEELANYKGGIVPLTINNEKLVEVEVRENPPEGEGGMGTVISDMEMVKVPWYRFYEGIVAGFEEAYYWGSVIFDGVFTMVGSLFHGRVPEDIAGPVGMYQATTAINESQGILAVVHFFAVVSVNLAVVNILPFPALDGGRIIFVLYEMITRRRPNQRFESTVNSIGMLILLALVVVITVSDISRVLGG